jgi:hypothetical protein
MGLSPLPDALDVVGTSEVIAVAWLAQPAALTVGLAGPAALGSRTEKVATGIMPVGREEFCAAAALASGRRGTHRPPSRMKTKPATESKTASGRRQKCEEGRKVFARNPEEDHPEEDGISNRRFSATIIPPLTRSASWRFIGPLPGKRNPV